MRLDDDTNDQTVFNGSFSSNKPASCYSIDARKRFIERRWLRRCHSDFVQSFRIRNHWSGD